ncbi:MAG: PKD domain protein [Methanoregula sp. PtaB.Bin085]|nr:MAG: PKD domain protein [Methanoregula sp. PtaB.Bin085]
MNVQFTDISIGYPTRWSWNFGDGSSTFTTTDPGQKDANHTYTAAGTYTVTLTVNNTQEAASVSHQVYVAGPPAAPTQNVVEYTSPGIYNYTVPAEIRSVYVMVVGAGGGGGGGSGGGWNGAQEHWGAPAGGGGSGYGQIYTVNVTPGDVIPVEVGLGGYGGMGGLYDFRYSPWICNPGMDGLAGGASQFGNVVMAGGQPGKGSVCHTTVGTNGTGYNSGTAGTPIPPQYTTNAGTGGSGGAGYSANGAARGSGGGGGAGGFRAKVYASYNGWSPWGNGWSGASGSNGYVRVEPIKPPVPVAGFNVTPYSGQYPVNVQFTDISIGYPTRWSWNFGDGSPAFTTTDPGQKDANHTYTAAGTYTVTLTVNNTQEAASVSHQVYVAGSPAAPTQNVVEYTSPGIYNYTVPAEIRSVYVMVVGAGGGGGGGSGGGWNGAQEHWGAPAGGGGSGYGQIYTVNVTPGDVIPVEVGLGGYGGMGGLYDFRYSPWICNPGMDGLAGGASQFGNVVMAGGQPGKGSVCHTTVGTNGTGYNSGTAGTPIPPQYTTNAGTGGSGGAGYSANGAARGSGGGGGAGGFRAKVYASYNGWSPWGNGWSGAAGSNGYVRIEPIKPPVPVAGFNVTPYSGPYPVNVQFTDISIGYPTRWSWNFGDGSPAFTTTDPGQKDANHTYTAAGTYTVTLTVNNTQEAASVSHQVYVAGPPAAPTQNVVEYTSPGVYNYTVAPSVGILRVTIVGAGGGGGGGSGGGWNGVQEHFGAPAGGGGSGYYNVSNISVAPGQVIPVEVGLGGYGGMGGLYDFRYSPWICSPGYDGFSGGNSQFGNITASGGSFGFGSVCHTTVGTNGTGYISGTAGTPTPPQYTNSAGTGGSGGAGYSANGARGGGGGGGAGGFRAKVYAAYNGWSPWGNGWSGAAGSNGYVRIEPFVLPKPAVSFNASPANGTAPLDVNFTDTSTNYPFAWYWDFGDGTNSTEQNPVHRYNVSGLYTINHSATNVNGTGWANVTGAVEVTFYCPLIVSFNTSESSGYAPLTVQYNDTSTSGSQPAMMMSSLKADSMDKSGDSLVKEAAIEGDPLETIISWTWYLGEQLGIPQWYNSTSYETRNPDPLTYDVGNYTPNLTVCCAICCNSTTGVVTAMENHNLVANFTASPRSVNKLQSVQFNDTSTGSPTTWLWSFGDGHSDSEQNPKHTYNYVGNFTVSLTVTNATASNTTVKQGYVNVTDEMTTYKVYAEAGDNGVGVLDMANGFYYTVKGSSNGNVSWVDWQNSNGIIDPSIAREDHWTTNSADWVDNSDFAYFSGHGSPAAFCFTYSDTGYYGAEASRIHLTSGRPKWVVLDACLSLYDGTWTQWSNSFNGLHMLLGWNTTTVPSYDPVKSRGQVFAELMQGEYPSNESQRLRMIDAWDWAGRYTWGIQPTQSESDIYNAVIYDENCINDHLAGWGDVCAAPSGNLHYYSILIFNKTEGIYATTRSLTMIEDSYSVDAKVPVTSDIVAIYKSVRPEYTKESVSSLAMNLGMSGNIRETPNAFYAGDTDTDQYYFVVQKDTGMISFQKFNARSGMPQPDRKSIEAVNRFLQDNNLLPLNSLEPAVVNNVGESISSTGERQISWKTNVISYPQMIDGLPVYNAQFTVEVDSENNIIGLFRNWREYQPYETVILKSPEQAFGELKSHQPQGKKAVKPDNVKVTGISLGYSLQASTDGEEYLQPLYILKGNHRHGTSEEPFEPVVIDANSGEKVKKRNIPPPTPTSNESLSENTTQNTTTAVMSVVPTMNFVSDNNASNLLPVIDPEKNSVNNTTDTTSQYMLNNQSDNLTIIVNETINNGLIIMNITNNSVSGDLNG